jgi:DNA (cytosine-5)-methyltransferase 1
VPEFTSWGELLSCNCGAGDYALEHAKGCTFARPDPERKGEHFDAFLDSLRSLGYDLEWRVLTCADYGDATTRKRFFLQAKKRYPGVPARPIIWPAPTHAPRAVAASRSLAEWRPARDIIDWSVPGRSIFGRKKGDKYPPLKPNTLRRIFAGLLRFSPFTFLCGPDGFHADGQPYVVILRNNATARDIGEPVPTITGGGQHLGLAQPILNHLDSYDLDSYLLGQQSGYAPRSTSDPVPAIATAGKIAMVQPYLMAMEHSTEGHERRCHPLSRPLPTVTGTGAFGLAKPVLQQYQPFLTKYHGSHEGKADGDGRSVSVDGPIPTLDTSNRFGLAQPYLLVNRTHAAPLSLEDPLRTLTTGGNFGLCEPLLIKYYGTGGAQPVGDPLDTVTTRDRFALVDPRLVLKGDPAVQGEVIGVLDILYRMLMPRELAGAHSFPATYFFFGTQEQQVKQVGNSVPVSTAEALCTEILRPYAPVVPAQGFHTHGLKEAV